MNSKALAFALVLAAIVVSGCTAPSTKETPTKVTGRFELMVSDRPANISSFDYLNVSFSEARIFEEVNNSETFEKIDLNGSRTVDLTQLQGEKARSLANTTLEAGNYTKIELYVAQTEAAVDGESVEVKVPPGKLMITKPFTVEPNSTTSFVFDIQVVLRGNQQSNQGYILKPVISESGVADKGVEVERAGRGN